MSEEEEYKILNKAIKTFGYDHQINKFVEEMGEVLQALMKFKNSDMTYNIDHIERLNDLRAELSDLSITLSQMFIMYGDEEINAYRASKLARLKQRIDEHGKA